MSSTSLDSENALMTVTSHATTAAIMKRPVISNQANDADSGTLARGDSGAEGVTGSSGRGAGAGDSSVMTTVQHGHQNHVC